MLILSYLRLLEGDLGSSYVIVGKAFPPFPTIFHLSGVATVCFSKVYIPPECKLVRVGNTNMLVSKNSRGPNESHNEPNESHNPKRETQRELVEYGHVGSRWPCRFRFCLCQFRLRWVANANIVSGGIWAYD